MNDKGVPFCANYLPLKVEEYSSLLGKTIKIAQKIKSEKPSKNLFDVIEFENLEFKKYSYEEQHELDNIDYEKQKQEAEKERKRLEEERNSLEYIQKQKKWQINMNNAMFKAVKKNNVSIPQEIVKNPDLITDFILKLEEDIKQLILNDLLKEL
jgi:hypothetical protein